MFSSSKAPIVKGPSKNLTLVAKENYAIIHSQLSFETLVAPDQALRTKMALESSPIR